MSRPPTKGRGLRAVHRVVGVACAPFLIVSALAGGLLLFRKTGLYERKGAFRELVQGLHNFEIVMPYVGIVACGLMVACAITGLLLYCRTWWRGR